MPLASPVYGVSELLQLMARLREPATGCPWDLKQHYRSITPSTIEEAYEVVDAIEREDYAHLKEELGDLLFQVVFYGQLAQEEGRWSFEDVVHDLTAKLIRRHPHVFPLGTLASRRSVGDVIDEASIKQSWEAIKQQEREGKGKHGVLADVPLALPALKRAEKLQKRAASVGFDWGAASEVLEKIEEEVVELSEVNSSYTQAVTEQEKASLALSVTEELGDLMFSCVNFARHLKLDSEQVLRAANQKFEKRFSAMEAQLLSEGVNLEDASPELMDECWRRVKRAE